MARQLNRPCTPAEVLFAVLLLLYQGTSALGTVVNSGVPFEGFEGCRCITAVDDLPRLRNASAAITALHPELDHITYGVGCAPHDAPIAACQPKTPPGAPGGLPPECVGVFPVPEHCETLLAVPSWCSASWCYIADSASCTVKHSLSNVDDTEPDGVTESISWSYATCGALDTFAGDPRRALAGDVVRVGMRSNTGGWRGAYHPNGNTFPTQKDAQWYGPYVDLMQRSAGLAGFYVNYTDAPAWVLAQAGSTSRFTQCVYATALGYLDFCVGNFMLTPERTRLTPFVTVDVESYRLVARCQESMGVWEAMTRVFQPFNATVWVVVLLVLVVVSLLIAAQEALSSWSHGKRARPMVKKREAAINVMKGLRSFTERKALHSPELSWGAHITTLGLGVFLLLLLALYSANLVAILVAETTGSAFRDIEDVVKSGATACALEVSVDLIHLAQPSLRLAADNSTGLEGHVAWSSLWDALAAGDCDVAIVTADQLQRQHALGAFCNWCLVGPAVIYAHAGVPVANRPDLISIHHGFQSILSTGEWRAILSDGAPDPMCGSDYDDSAASLSFSIWDVMGPLAVMVLLVIAGLVTSAIDLVRDLRRDQRPSESLKAVLRRKWDGEKKADAGKVPPTPPPSQDGDQACEPLGSEPDLSGSASQPTDTPESGRGTEDLAPTVGELWGNAHDPFAAYEENHASSSDDVGEVQRGLASARYRGDGDEEEGTKGMAAAV